jgi:hypothetical protein
MALTYFNYRDGNGNPPADEQLTQELCPALARAYIYSAWKYTRGAGIVVGVLDMDGPGALSATDNPPGCVAQTDPLKIGSHGYGCLSTIGSPLNGVGLAGVAPAAQTRLYVGDKSSGYSDMTAIAAAAGLVCQIVSNSTTGATADWALLQSRVLYFQAVSDINTHVANAIETGSASFQVGGSGANTRCITGETGGWDQPVYGTGAAYRVISPVGRQTTVGRFGGQSEATPAAAGVAALIWSINPTWTKEQVGQILLTTLDPGTHPAFAAAFPNGGITNALRGVTKAMALKSVGGAGAGTIYPFACLTGDSLDQSAALIKLNGSFFYLAGAYCSSPITSVKLYIGGTESGGVVTGGQKVYDSTQSGDLATGSDTIGGKTVYYGMSGTAYKSVGVGANQPGDMVTLIVTTATGTLVETYQDVIVDKPNYHLTMSVDRTNLPLGSALLYGTRALGATVSVTATVPNGATPPTIDLVHSLAAPREELDYQFDVADRTSRETRWECRVDNIPPETTTITVTSSDGERLTTTLRMGVLRIASVQHLSPGTTKIRGSGDPNNGSPALSIVQGTVAADRYAPTVRDFRLGALSGSYPVTSFVASDDAQIAKYAITPYKNPPLANSSEWKTWPTGQPRVTGAKFDPAGVPGNYMAYPWLMDTAGRVSPVYGAPQPAAISGHNAVFRGFGGFGTPGYGVGMAVDGDLVIVLPLPSAPPNNSKYGMSCGPQSLWFPGYGPKGPVGIHRNDPVAPTILPNGTYGSKPQGVDLGTTDQPHICIAGIPTRLLTLENWGTYQLASQNISNIFWVPNWTANNLPGSVTELSGAAASSTTPGATLSTSAPYQVGGYYSFTNWILTYCLVNKGGNSQWPGPFLSTIARIGDGNLTLVGSTSARYSDNQTEWVAALYRVDGAQSVVWNYETAQGVTLKYAFANPGSVVSCTQYVQCFKMAGTNGYGPTGNPGLGPGY